MLSTKDTGKTVYSASKFIQLLGAHWWRRQLQGTCQVVAVSPGLIPGTRLSRGSDFDIPDNLPDAKSVPEGMSRLIQPPPPCGGRRAHHKVQVRKASSGLSLEMISPKIRSRSSSRAGVSGGPRRSMS